MISVYQLQIFLMVVEYKSFSAAAEQLSMSQPAVSQQIRALEEYYKVKLFARYGQRIELTEAGFALLDPARHLVNEAVQLDERFNAGAGELHGRITLLCSRNAAGALYLLPELLARFYREYPEVQFFIESSSEEEALARLLEREVAFSILSHIPRQKNLESFLLYHDELQLITPPDHRWNGAKVSLKELKGQRVVMRRAGSETRRRIELALRAAGLNLGDLRIMAELDSAEGIALAVEAGLGLGFLSNLIARRFHVGHAELSLAEPEIEAGADLSREHYLIRNRPSPARPPSPSQQRFWENLRLK